MPIAPGFIVSAQGATSAVMSLTNPAAACSARPPPPHDWKTSGGVPACMAVAILVLSASFSRTVELMVTFGCASMYSWASVASRDLPGSLVCRFHHSTVTGSAAASDGAVLGATLAASDGAAADG